MTFTNVEVAIDDLPSITEIEFRELEPAYARLVLGIVLVAGWGLLAAGLLVWFLAIRPGVGGSGGYVAAIVFGAVTLVMALNAVYRYKAARAIGYAVRIRRDWLDMALGRMNVIFEQITHQAAREPGQGASLDKHVLVPSVEERHTRTLLDEALAADCVTDLNFTGVSPRYLYKAFAIVTVVCLMVAVAIGQSPLGILPVWTLHSSFLSMRWKRWGLAVDAGNLVIRKGVLGVDHVVIPAFKVQEISRRRTPLMRRHDLSSLHLRVAAGKHAVPYLPDAVVAGAINYTLYEVESTSRSWM